MERPTAASELHRPITALKPRLAPERYRSSCVACRNRKVGCNRLLPSCSNCQKWNTECQYQLTPSRLRKALAKSSQGKGGRPVRIRPVEMAMTTTTSTTTPSFLPSPRVSLPPPPTLTTEQLVPPIEGRETCMASVRPDNPAGPLPPTLPAASAETVVVEIPGTPSSERALIPSSLPSSPNLVNSATAMTTTPQLPMWLRICIMKQRSNIPLEDTFSEWTMRLLVRLKRYRRLCRPPRGDEDSVAGLTTYDSWNGYIPPYGGEHLDPDAVQQTHRYQLPGLRPLFVPADLMYHSGVVRFVLNGFCSLALKDTSPIHSLRIIYRLDNQLVPEAFQLAIMMAAAPFSNHPIFEHFSPYEVSSEYHTRLLHELPQCLADPAPDMFAALSMLTEVTLSLGRFALHQMLTTISFRKHQSARVYLMDHPNPPPRPLHLGVGKDLLVDVPTIQNEFLREYYR
ncbi:hypothetical protein H4R33_005786, partial [Dimargaris cristalligena]